MPDRNLTLCLPRPSSGLNPHVPVILSTPKPTRIPQNHILIKVDKFGFSANNITYQALGEHPHFRYFDFHPIERNEIDSQTSAVSPDTHGLIPVWSFGTVVISTHPKVKVGERLYGYLAPTRYLLVPISPSDLNKFALYVPRPLLPADRRPYNQLLRCANDPQYVSNETSEDLTMLYRPLFWTSFWCEDWLMSSNYRGGAKNILISSASSKTAFCLAYLIKKRISNGEIATSTRVIGLTSTANVSFTQGLALYNEVSTYDTFASTRSLNSGHETRWIYVDVAGNDELNKRVLSHFASPYTGALAAFIALGMTNLRVDDGTTAQWNATNTFETSPQSNQVTSSFWPQQEQFFMVEWLNVRKHQLKIEDIFARQNKAWSELLRDCAGWVQLQRVSGADNVKRAYEHIVQVGLAPTKGLIWSLWDDDKNQEMARL